MNIGIIGLGNIWKWQYKALNLLNNFNIVSVCDIDMNKLDSFSLANATKYQNYKDLILDANVDCILVSTTPNTHFGIAMDVLRNKKHLLIEKPVILAPEQMELLNNYKDKNVMFVSAFHAAFATDLVWFKEKYNTEFITDFGDITGFECNFYDPYVINNCITDKAIGLEGSWIDSGVNALSVIGELINTNDIMRQEKIINESNTKGIAKFIFSEERHTGIIKTDWTLDSNHKSTTLFFNEIKVILNHSEQRVYLVKDGQTKILFESNNRERLLNQYIGVFENFYHCIEDNKDNFNYALKIHQLLL